MEWNREGKDKEPHMCKSLSSNHHHLILISKIFPLISWIVAVNARGIQINFNWQSLNSLTQWGKPPLEKTMLV